MRERMPSPRIERRVDTSETADWLEDETQQVRTLFAQLPPQLWERHRHAIEDIATEHVGLAPEEQEQVKLAYLSRVVEARRAGLEEFKSNDAHFQEFVSERQLGEQLHELLDSSENTLGAGMTARVKRLNLPDVRHVAVKYLLTPTEKTLSAEGEHDMLWEVDIVTNVEKEEQKLDTEHRVRVPHPHFYYKNKTLQCYGMEEVKGQTIEQLTNTKAPNTLAETEQREAVREALRHKYGDPAAQAALLAELERFASAMHNVCLHGDIKPGNLMVDEEGTVYLIDFGQSVDMNTMKDTTREQFENLQVLERDQLKYCVRTLLADIMREKHPV